MEDWPLWAQDRIEFLTGAMGGEQGRAILTICPHCRDTIQTQYKAFRANFSNVLLHTPYLAKLVKDGDLELESRPLTAALHTPCKVFHNDEHGGMQTLLRRAGVTLKRERMRQQQQVLEQIQATGLKDVVTGCPGCHRMLGVMKDEESRIADVATVLLERVKGGGAA